MRCTNCKNDISDGSFACPECGATQIIKIRRGNKKACPVCGLAAFSDDEYCEECGYTFNGSV